MKKNYKELELLVLPPTENIEEIIKDLPIKLTKAYYASLEFHFKDNIATILHEGRDIKTFSFVWLSSTWYTRDLATTVKLYLEKNNVPHSFVEQNTSKITDTMNFVLNEIPYPDTYYIESSKAMERLDEIEEICGYPMIMKSSKGFGGNDTSYIASREELIENISNRKENKKYLFQRYIENNYDWGILVANNEIISAERSYPMKGEFRNNSSAGATEVFEKLHDIPEDIKAIALKAGNVLGLQWSRSDIIVDSISGLPYLLEVNRFPGITMGSTEVTGASAFIKNCLGKVSNCSD
ncbi:MAG: RimK family alpha-L-glutamate ligase [Candidatus Dojkabacteria bacterium]